ncbi:GNAT family N-acetyltransferase [Rhodococcus spongiicola]|uniref:N-acetyltransferase n=1 Tax=Rhodococcus spongiicola TaxID=2487352 RepID=A0A438B5C2_9NOCA|nr:GNAT family N-acetyltransferase [Rhodococcus spongiicola]RVW06194.1 N-acetyltransferase [Rhodococcus spongiicola]
MTDEPDAELEVQPLSASLRYEIRVGAELAGFTEFVDSGEQRIFFHTEVDERFAGRGLASTLIRTALDDATSRGRRIVPICPFVAGFLDKHLEFVEYVDAVTPAAQRTVMQFRT